MSRHVALSSVVAVLFLLPALALAAGNIVPNGDFETVSSTSSTTPQGWTGDFWGTLTATFTYPVAGDGSPSAAEVTITKYTSGAAEWYFGDVAVTAGTTYQVSDNYLSTVASEVDAEFLSSTGAYSYVQIAAPASSNGAWATFSGSVTVPAGTVSMSLIHVINKVGSLTIDNVSISSGSTTPPPPPPAKPTITSFSSNPTSITSGQSSMLSWVTTNASSTTISPTIGTVTGTSVSVSPTATTTYTLTATNPQGSVSTTTTVGVSATPPPPPPPTKPVITSFTANPVTINSGQSSTLSWAVTGATLLSIDQGVGTVTGTSKNISPTATTTYTLSAGNSAGTTTATAVVNVVVPQTPPPPPPTNLITNGNFAAGSTNNPTDWNADDYGSLKATFAYPVAGPSGGKAVEVTVSSFKNGDADWDPNLITVTPGALYTFADTYEATVASEIDVEYVVKKANNMPNECSADSNTAYVDCYEVMASSLPASATFASFTTTVSPPPGSVSMTVLHLLAGNGSLTLGSESLTAGVAAGEGYAQGIVSLTFDDGYLDHYTNALPILQSAPGGAMHGTFYMIPNDTTDKTQTGYMTIAQMLTMQADGNDMASHTADHCDLVTLLANPASATDGGKSDGVDGAAGIGCPDHALKAATTSQAEITNSKIELAGFGATPDNNLAYPFGSYSAAVEAQVQAGGFLAARTIDQGFNTKATNPYALVVQDLDETTPVATVEQWINTAAANKVWLILVFHQIDSLANANDIYDVTPANFQSIVTYLGQNKDCVLTVGQVMSGKTTCP